MRNAKPAGKPRAYWYLIPLVLVVIGLMYCLHKTEFDAMQLLAKYGYLIILVWTFLEGETIVIVAGAASGALGLNPWLIVLSSFCGSFLSDQFMFSLGKYKGEAVLGYFPRIARNVDRAAKLFKRYDTILILGFRFVYGVRNVTPILLGISGVSHKKFFILNMIGASIWALTFTFGGLYAGRAFTRLMENVGHGILFGILGLLSLAGALWFIRARMSVKRARKIASQDSTDDNLPPT